jgi:hypothetical protein
MDAEQFDSVAKVLGQSNSRRGVVRTLTGAALGGILVAVGVGEAGAKKKHGAGGRVTAEGRKCKDGQPLCGKGKNACCTGGKTCLGGLCVTTPCVPNCTDKCGGASDGCSGTCDAACQTCIAHRVSCDPTGTACCANLSCLPDPYAVLGFGDLCGGRLCYGTTGHPCSDPCDCATGGCTSNGPDVPGTCP